MRLVIIEMLLRLINLLVSIVLFLEEKKASIETSNQELKNLKQKQVELEEKLNNQDSTKEKDKKAAQEKIKQTKQFLDKNSKSSQQFQKVSLILLVFFV